MSKRLTLKEWEAIEYAIAAALVGELDGFNPSDDEYDDMRARLESAQQKVWERLP